MNDNVFEKSSVIWSGCSFGENEYTEVYESIAWEKGNTLIRLSVCGDYTLFVNGKYVSSNQYGDFKHYKIYDEIDITRYLTNGKNDIGILVWYFGKNGMRYLSETPCIIYEIINDGELVAFSSDATLSRKSKAYASGLNKKITDQLGYSFDYDSTLEDNWLMGELDGFEHSCVLDNHFTFFNRPILKHDLQSLVKGKVYTCDNK